MEYWEKFWNWISLALIFIGVIAIYILLSKDKIKKRIDNLDDEIKDIEKEIKKQEKKRESLIADADEHAKTGSNLDKEIKKAKSKQRNLDIKRKLMKDIFDKYGS